MIDIEALRSMFHVTYRNKARANFSGAIEARPPAG